jgi:hypothetical protein
MSWLTGQGIQTTAERPQERNLLMGTSLPSPNSNKGKLLVTQPAVKSYDSTSDRNTQSSYLQKLRDRWQFTESSKAKIDAMTNEVVKSMTTSLTAKDKDKAKDKDTEKDRDNDDEDALPKPRVSFQPSNSGTNRSSAGASKKVSKVPQGIADAHSSRGTTKYPTSTRNEMALRGGLIVHNVRTDPNSMSTVALDDDGN